MTFRDRKHSMLKLLLGFILSFAVLGPLSSAASAATSSGTIEICKTAVGPGVSGSFQFTVSALAGQAFTVPVGQCSQPITVTAGQVTVTESARDAYMVADVTAQPAGTLVSKNTAAGSATVRVEAGGVANQTIVTFVNKVVEKGFLEVCKKAQAGTTLGGTFSFRVAAVGVATQLVTAPVGGCSPSLSLPAGNATITEDGRSDASLVAIEVAPVGRLIGAPDITTRSVTVQIVAGGIATETIVTFTNKPVAPPKGLIKVCKRATADAPTGTAFSFTVDSTTVSVQAGSCSLPLAVAMGTAIVTEATVTGFVVSAIDVDPASARVSIGLAERTASVTVTADRVTEVTFTNKKATGVLKICKAAGVGVVAGQTFDFTAAGQTVQVQATFCSLPITLPVGNVTVDEAVPVGFVVEAIMVAGAGSLVSNNLASGSAVVTVAPGATEVIFTNKKKSDVSGCTVTKGFYKKHHRAVEQLLVGTGGKLTVGGASLTAAQIDAIYDRNSKNYLNQVSQQLTTTLLNQLNGASTPSAVQTAINAAQLLIEQSGGPLAGSGKSQKTVLYNGVTYTASQLVRTLSGYNEGKAPGGPRHCDDDDDHDDD
jgi:hypothetical protein